MLVKLLLVVPTCITVLRHALTDMQCPGWVLNLQCFKNSCRDGRVPGISDWAGHPWSRGEPSWMHRLSVPKMKQALALIDRKRSGLETKYCSSCSLLLPLAHLPDWRRRNHVLKSSTFWIEWNNEQAMSKTDFSYGQIICFGLGRQLWLPARPDWAIKSLHSNSKIAYE
jgi:hypothetical protein